MMTQDHNGTLHYSASAVQYSNGPSRANGMLAANFQHRKSDGLKDTLQTPYENGSHSPSLSPKSSPLHSSNDALNSSASVSSGVGSHSSSILTPSPASNASLADYLSQLIKDRKKIQEMPWNNFEHVNRLLDEEIEKVRKNLFDWNPEAKEQLILPEANGDVMEMQEKVFIPSEEHPDFNFVGRILGPRGLTAKQLEKTTQCKIMIRGQGSMRDKAKEELNRGKPTWEHLSEKLHVLITAKDTPDRARIKLNHAVSEIRKLLVPVKESDDELKKRQLMELAILNGTYRDSSPKPQQFLITAPAISQYYLDANAARLGLLNLSRQNALGTPLVLPSVQGGRPMSAMSSTASSTPSYYATPSPSYMNDAMTMANGGFLINPYEYATYNHPGLATSFLNGEYATVDQLSSAAGGFYRG